MQCAGGRSIRDLRALTSGTLLICRPLPASDQVLPRSVRARSTTWQSGVRTPAGAAGAAHAAAPCTQQQQHASMINSTRMLLNTHPNLYDALRMHCGECCIISGVLALPVVASRSQMPRALLPPCICTGRPALLALCCHGVGFPQMHGCLICSNSPWGCCQTAGFLNQS